MNAEHRSRSTGACDTQGLLQKQKLEQVAVARVAQKRAEENFEEELCFSSRESGTSDRRRVQTMCAGQNLKLEPHSQKN